jgi:hypothetical protein
MECLCLKGLSAEGLKGGMLTGDHERYVKKGSGMDVCLCRGLLGNTEGHCFVRGFVIRRYINRYVKMSCKQESLSVGACWGTQRDTVL